MLRESVLSTNVKAVNITYRNITADSVYAGQFMCGNENEINCVGINFEHVHLNVTSSGGCIFSGVHGTSDDVSPASCEII